MGAKINAGGQFHLSGFVWRYSTNWIEDEVGKNRSELITDYVLMLWVLTPGMPYKSSHVIST
jgi:hypothetical protein